MPVQNPSGVPVVGPSTPYITPDILTAAPTGIAWSTIGAPGTTVTPAQQYAEQLNLCMRSTAMIDGFCNQPLRATVDTEELTGPGDFRCQLQPTGVARLLLSRWPVTSVVSGRVSSAAAFPRSWATIAGTQFEPEKPLIGVYGTTAPGVSGGGGQGVLLAPGWVTWMFGRMANRIQITYVNGWPHAALTTAASAAGTSLVVDDITGWAGAAGNIYDGNQQEFVSVTTVTPATAGAISGPGTLTLSAGLSYPHDKGTLVSTLPASIMQAAIYCCVSIALTRGATATTVQTISGGQAGGGTQNQQAYLDMAKTLVAPFRRTL